MKYSTIIGFLTFLISHASLSDYEQEDGIIILDEGNFDTAIKEFPFIMVEFYAPWCSHCQRLVPEYQSVADTMRGSGSDIVFAKIEAEKALNISSNHMIRGYPTLKLFRSGRSKTYDGIQRTYNMFEWLMVNAVPLVTIIQDINELQVFKQQQQDILIYFTLQDEAEKDQNTFAFMADQCEGIFFGLTRNQEMRKSLQLKEDQRIVLYSQFQEIPIKMSGDITLESIWYFVQNSSYPIIFNYNDREKLFVEEMEHSAIYLFLDGVESDIPEEQAFKKLAHKLKGEMIFVRLSKAEKEGRDAWISNKFHDKFGLTEFPCVYIQDTRNYRPFKKYRLNGEINEDTMTQFITDFKEDKLQQFFKSQNIPTTQRNSVRNIVGLNFKEEVLDNEKDVLVLFYGTYNQESRNLSVIYEHIATKLKDVNPNIILARIDCTENEINGYNNIETFPTLKFFKKIGYFLDEPLSVEFTGEKTQEGILEFLMENTSFQWIDLYGEDEYKKNEEKKVEEKEDQIDEIEDDL